MYITPEHQGLLLFYASTNSSETFKGTFNNLIDMVEGFSIVKWTEYHISIYQINVCNEEQLLKDMM